MAANRKYLQMAAYIMIAAICIIAIGVTRNCGRLQPVAKEGFSQGDTLDIAILYTPGSYYFHSDSIGGINYDIARYFSEETDLPVKIWPATDPAAAMEKLETGAFDVLASFPLDYNIKKRFLTSESIFLDRLVLVQLKDSTTGNKPVVSSLDLDGKKVYVVPESAASNRMENLAEEIGGNIEIEQLPDMSEELLVVKVATGDIPLAVVNEKVAKNLSDKYPLLDYNSSVSFTQFQVWLFNREDSVQFRQFNTWFENFSTTETYKSIISAY